MQGHCCTTQSRTVEILSKKDNTSSFRGYMRSQAVVLKRQERHMISDQDHLMSHEDEWMRHDG